MPVFEFDIPHYFNYLVFLIDIYNIFIDLFIDSLVLCPFNSELRESQFIMYPFLVYIKVFLLSTILSIIIEIIKLV